MKKYALVIGVEEYRDSMISRLQYARSDATALAERLRGRCAFDQVRVLAESTGSDEPLLVNIVSALRDISGELCPEDLFLFFFAGHGVEKDGHGYLLARDSLQAYPEHGSLSLELLRKSFEKLCASKRVLLLDACRNDPDAGRGDSANRMGEVISRDIVAAARSRQGGGTTTALLSACRSGQRAYEWPTKGHGVFTQYLIEGLDGAAWEVGELEFERLAAFAADRVRQWSANTPGLPIPQEPWYEKFGDPGSIILATEQANHPSATASSLIPKAELISKRRFFRIICVTTLSGTYIVEYRGDKWGYECVLINDKKVAGGINLGNKFIPRFQFDAGPHKCMLLVESKNPGTDIASFKFSMDGEIVYQD